MRLFSIMCFKQFQRNPFNCTRSSYNLNCRGSHRSLRKASSIGLSRTWRVCVCVCVCVCVSLRSPRLTCLLAKHIDAPEASTEVPPGRMLTCGKRSDYVTTSLTNICCFNRCYGKALVTNGIWNRVQWGSSHVVDPTEWEAQKIHPKSRNTQEQSLSHELFREVRMNFPYFPVIWVRNPAEIVQKNLFRWTFLFWVEFSCGFSYCEEWPSAPPLPETWFTKPGSWGNAVVFPIVSCISVRQAPGLSLGKMKFEQSQKMFKFFSGLSGTPVRLFQSRYGIVI